MGEGQEQLEDDVINVLGNVWEEMPSTGRCNYLPRRESESGMGGGEEAFGFSASCL